MVNKDPNQLSRADSLDRYYLGEELEDEKIEKEEEEEETAGVCESKFVMPKSVGVGGETTSASSVKEEQQHYCYSCKRGFNSGKALGGHMSSAHVQAGRDYQSKRRLMSGSSDDEDEDGAAGVKAEEYACCICEKVFPKEKSLHGHMRKHPDRPYRGMNPPHSASPSSSQPKKKTKTRRHQSPMLEEEEVSKDPSSASSDHDHNEEDKSLDDIQPAVRRIINPPDSPAADASEKPKAGELISFSSSGADDQWSSVPCTVDEELSDLVNSLVRLSNTAENKEEICTCDPNPVPFDGNQTPPPPRDHEKSIEEVYERNPSNVNIPAADSDESNIFKDVKISIFGDSERKLEESPQAQGKAPLIMEPNNNQNNSPRNSSEEDNEKTSLPSPVLENQDQTYFEPRNSGSKKRIEIQKKGKGKVLSGAEKEKKTYKCSSCNRVFATHQALGGHMSSHNKSSSSGTTTRFTLQNNNNAASDNNPSSCSRQNQFIPQLTNNSSSSHPCLICSKTFSSGQALGGHMRCHASQFESSSPQENNNNSGCNRQQKVLDFDLNELPNDDDDDHIE